MRISRYWFRTRLDRKHPVSYIYSEPRRDAVTRCKCETCDREFNRSNTAKNFTTCDSCVLAVRNRSPEARQRSSNVFTQYYSCRKNREIHSIAVAKRYLNDQYSVMHRNACIQRSADEGYRKKLSDNAARGEQHAIKTSCGLRKIPIKSFENFLTEENVRLRAIFTDTVGKECLQKANYTCVLCNKKGHLNAHHLDAWHWAVDKRFDLDNLVCLCHTCHQLFHTVYGKHNNTRQQFEEFKLLNIRG